MHNLHIAWILTSRKTFFIKMFSVDKLLWNIVVIIGWFIRLICSKRIKLLVQVVFLFFFKKTHSREACNLFTTFESLQQWWRLHQYCWQHPQSKQPHIVLLSIVHSRDEWVSWVFETQESEKKPVFRLRPMGNTKHTPKFYTKYASKAMIWGVRYEGCIYCTSKAWSMTESIGVKVANFASTK